MKYIINLNSIKRKYSELFDYEKSEYDEYRKLYEYYQDLINKSNKENQVDSLDKTGQFTYDQIMEKVYGDNYLKLKKCELKMNEILEIPDRSELNKLCLKVINDILKGYDIKDARIKIYKKFTQKVDPKENGDGSYYNLDKIIAFHLENEFKKYLEECLKNKKLI